mmetsp:Transcript_34497/g.73608  ORF Transcript_34497/g.73608 Transcript_34497/m.73608 type:complete len:298 (+) Transcript_34497:111-1004(+)|eukprot:CAMPEP_0183342986 /NCGR_PEP_ID=MMETSP0164_2-20130417/8985_1 /TAXON_ID=221442 /ORGANISM="Coccolithus pelagicus ssp braarudi, Strain PLY182g" /LENGTH=297 /DNA_ID=CAMNT_0025513717 /DNA_START=102 /DNA_END=995 /DNA_ORIENTATION=+
MALEAARIIGPDSDLVGEVQAISYHYDPDDSSPAILGSQPEHSKDVSGAPATLALAGLLLLSAILFQLLRHYRPSTFTAIYQRIAELGAPSAVPPPLQVAQLCTEQMRPAPEVKKASASGAERKKQRARRKNRMNAEQALVFRPGDSSAVRDGDGEADVDVENSEPQERTQGAALAAAPVAAADADPVAALAVLATTKTSACRSALGGTAYSGEATEQMIGFLQDGELLLRNEQGVVFSSERDMYGNLTRIGDWDSSTRVARIWGLSELPPIIMCEPPGYPMMHVQREPNETELMHI